ncbi:MAG: hypothetical protein IKY79_03465 [Bacteroidales bacterium]|nr:hypothetical protein [Bacteroidales bacterium]
MKEIHIERNNNGEIIIDENIRTNGISITLVNEKGNPIARYEFDIDKISNLTKLMYKANNVRIRFYVDSSIEITPTMQFEITSGRNCQ